MPEFGQQGAQGEALDDERAKHDAESSEDDEVAIGKGRTILAIGQCQRGSQRHNSPHAAP
jgi:hypothetical protein